MGITRDDLYTQVWAEPMLAVAARHKVSASYLARICECLNVPRPPRGYWARVESGQRPKVPPLPGLRPGDEAEWSPGTAPRSYVMRRPERTKTNDADQVAVEDGPRRHGLLIGLKEYYDAARLSSEGYLRPHKRLMPDIYVSKDSLARALDVANQLFLAFEAAGYRVMFGSADSWRPELDQREKPGPHPLWQTWRPSRPTVVLVGHLPFALTLYEVSEVAPVRYVNGQYVRADKDEPGRRRRPPDGWVTTGEVPSGRLALRACAVDWRAKWEMHWRESEPGQLPSRFRTIRRELKAAVPVILERVEEASRQAEIERRRWEAELRERDRRDRADRRARAQEESREHLLNLVEDWALARRVEGFFEDAARRLSDAPPDVREALQARLERARKMLGGTDALERFGQWKAAEERDPGAHERDDD